MVKKNKETKKVNTKEVKEEIKVVKLEEPEEEIIIKEITEEEGKKRLFTKRDIVIAVGFLVIGVALSIAFVNRVPKLKDGSEAVVSLKDKDYSSQELYEEIKKTHGLNTILRKIDLDLVKKYYNGSKDEEIKKNATEQAETYIKQYSSYGYTEESFLAQYGFKNRDEFIAALQEDNILTMYYNDAVKSTITDEEVSTYYNSYGIGKKTVYMFSEKDSTDNLEAIRKLLKKGTAIDKVVSKYKDNSKVVINDKLEVDYKTITSYTSSVIDVIKSTAAGKYSKVFTDSSLGNVVIYVSDAEDAPKQDDIKDDILDVLVGQKQSADQKLYYVTFINLRKDNGIKFYDNELKSQYAEYVKTYTTVEENKEQ